MSVAAIESVGMDETRLSRWVIGRHFLCHGMQAPRASSLTCPFERGSGAAAGTRQTPACSAHRDSLVVQGHQCSRSSNSDSLNCENARRALYAQPMRSATLVVGRASSVRLPASDIARLPGRGVCIALYAGSVAALLLSPLGHGWPFVDLAVYRLGGESVVNGTHLYALRFPGALAFTYPPLAGPRRDRTLASMTAWPASQPRDCWMRLSPT